MNNSIKRVKRVDFGFRSFGNFRSQSSALRKKTQLVITRHYHTPLIFRSP